jgi:hypothetical protein
MASPFSIIFLPPGDCLLERIEEWKDLARVLIWQQLIEQ